MAVRPIILERIPNSGDVVMISNSGISFSASFIKSKELHTMVSVGFFIDDKDQYKLLFKFYKEEGLPNTLVLLKQGRGGVSNGRTVKAQEVFSKNRVLSSIQKLKNKSSKTFDIKFDKFDKVTKINEEIIKNLHSPDRKKTCAFCYKKGNRMVNFLNKM